MAILEAVVKQTGVYGPTRRGRLSVFWGDQVGDTSESELRTQHPGNSELRKSALGKRSFESKAS
jgi:hypothetical protein